MSWWFVLVIFFLREAQEEKDPNVTLGLLAQEPQKGRGAKLLFEFCTLQLGLLVTMLFVISLCVNLSFYIVDLSRVMHWCTCTPVHATLLLMCCTHRLLSWYFFSKVTSWFSLPGNYMHYFHSDWFLFVYRRISEFFLASMRFINKIKLETKIVRGFRSCSRPSPVLHANIRSHSAIAR